MSQVTIPAEKSGSLPTGPRSPDKAGRESLHYYLIEAARTMRRVELGVGITGWLSVLVIFLLAAILVDHWLWPLNTLARFAVLISIVGWTLWWVPKRILPLLFQSIHPEHAARRIERQHPEMKESLISWLQLSTHTEHTAPRGVLATVGRFAVRNLGGQDSTSIIDSANLIRLAALLFGFLLTGTVYLFASPKSGTTSLARILMPWSNIAPAARVRIVSVAPGTTTITQGTSLPISVTVRGMLKGDQVFVRYDLSDGQQIGQRLKMNEDIEGINYRLDFGKSFGGIHQPLSYWIDAGDASAGPFALSVQVVPIVAIDRIEFEFPKYTKQRPRTILQEGAIEAPEGTRVKLFAHANQPMAKSRLEFDPVVGNGVLLSSSQLIELETHGTELSGGWLLRLDKNGTNPTLSTYRVKATNNLNESNGDPVIYKIKVLGDLPPEVRLHPDSQSNKDNPRDVPIDGSQEIEMRGVDPDFGLVSLTVLAKLTNRTSDKEKVIETICFESSAGTTLQVVKVFTFKPSEYDLKVGDILEFRAIAKDNRCKVGEDTPEPNQASSSPLLIRIVAAELKSLAEKDLNSIDQKEEKKADKNKNSSKTDKSKSPTTDDKKSDDKSDATAKQSEKQNPTEQSVDKQKNKQGDQNSENQKKDKSKETSSGESQSGTGNESSESDDSKDGSSSGNQSNSNKNDASKSKSSLGSDPKNDNASGSEEGNESADDQNGTSSNTKNSSSPKIQQSSRSQDKDWNKPADDAEAFERIDELRREREEKQSGEKQTAEKQSGEKQSGEKQSGEKQSGEKQSGEKQSGEKQSGEKQSGEKQSGEKQSGEKQSGEKQSGEKQSGEKQSGEKQSGEKQSGEKQTGEKQTGEKQSGEKQSGEKQSGEKQSGEKQSGEKQSGEKQSGEKQSGEKQSGDKQSGDKQSGEKQSGEKQSGEKQSDDKQSDDKQSGDKQSGDKQSGDKQSGDKQSSDKQPSDKQSSDKQPSDKQSSDKQSSDKQSSDKQSSDKQTSDKQSSDKQASDKQASDKQSSDKQSSDKQSSDKQTSDKQSSDKHSSDKQSSDKQSSDKQSSDKQSSDKQSSDKQSSDKQSSDKQSSDKQSSGKQASDKQASDKQAGDKQSSDKQAGEKPAGDKTGTSSQGSNKEGAANPGSAGKGTDNNIEKREEPANKEYADKVTDLALDYLKQQKDQPDPELLKRLKWTNEDMKKFLDRWTEAKEFAKTDPNKKRELDAAMKTLGKRLFSGKERNVLDRDDELKGFLEEGSRVRPPESVRTGFEQFRRAVGKQ